MELCEKCAKARKERKRGRASKKNCVYDYIILVNANVIDLIDANYITVPTNQGKKTRECFEQKRPLYQV